MARLAAVLLGMGRLLVVDVVAKGAGEEACCWVVLELRWAVCVRVAEVVVVEEVVGEDLMAWWARKAERKL